jgi:hypothetical protein|tara:strand:+ start:49 stop:789 length:741 start_codon:yes stop_codon:yes gene_type:complete
MAWSALIPAGMWVYRFGTALYKTRNIAVATRMVRDGGKLVTKFKKPGRAGENAKDITPKEVKSVQQFENIVGSQMGSRSGLGTQTLLEAGKIVQADREKLDGLHKEESSSKRKPKVPNKPPVELNIKPTVKDPKPNLTEVRSSPKPAPAPDRGIRTKKKVVPKENGVRKSLRPKLRPANIGSKPISLGAYLNAEIKKRGSTVTEQKAKAEKGDYKSIAAAKKAGSLYYYKGKKLMAAVYEKDLKGK